MPDPTPNPTQPSHLIRGRSRQEVAKAMGITLQEVTALETRALLKIGSALKTSILADPDLCEILNLSHKKNH
jgi:transcriptional regulator